MKLALPEHYELSSINNLDIKDELNIDLIISSDLNYLLKQLINPLNYIIVTLWMLKGISKYED